MHPHFRFPSEGNDNYGCHDQADDGAINQRRINNIDDRHLGFVLLFVPKQPQGVQDHQDGAAFVKDDCHPNSGQAGE